MTERPKPCNKSQMETNALHFLQNCLLVDIEVNEKGKQSHQKIVEDLNNQHLADIVSAPLEENMLVLAGPGAGKTRVIVHRAAYLLRVVRVHPRSILVLCFNRSAAISLRRRLRDLAGPEALGVRTMTFHGLALTLTGQSLAVSPEHTEKEAIDFSRIVKDAIHLLQGSSEALGYAGETPRDTIIGRFSHILVDEYQDIDEEQYQLIGLLTGKTEQEHEQKMTIMAVGDDDQNIYRFRGANISFIRRFREDYAARTHYLLENYRSTANIIAAANCLIHHNADRMKQAHPIEINAARKNLPAGGNWEINDPVGQGKVQILHVANVREQGYGIYEEIIRLQRIEGDDG